MAVINVDQSIINIVLEYIELLRTEINVTGVYLYGSYAKGTYNQDSDIDIAVISDDFTGNPVEDTLKLMKIRRKVDCRIEPHPFKLEDFNENDPHAREIIRQSVKVS